MTARTAAAPLERRAFQWNRQPTFTFAEEQ